MPRLPGGVLAMLLLVLLSASITASAYPGAFVAAAPSIQSFASPAPSDVPHCHHGHHQDRLALAVLRSTVTDVEPAALAPLARPIATAPRVKLPPLFLPGRIMAPPPPLYLLTQRFRS